MEGWGWPSPNRGGTSQRGVDPLLDGLSLLGIPISIGCLLLVEQDFCTVQY